MPEKEEPFANPPPPPSAGGGEKNESKDAPHPMTNEDFRKLLMTPRSVTSRSSLPSKSSSSHIEIPSSERSSIGGEDDKAERRKKKKSFYAKLKKQEDVKMAELALKYRDRARERREGANPDYQSEDPISTTAGYRAVAPDVKSGLDAAERRRQMIQESKFLGGDMEHTHLVKGLDYALLQKVRSEITLKEKEEDGDFDEVAPTSTKVQQQQQQQQKEPDMEEQLTFKTRMAKNVIRQVFKNKFPEKNDHFLPGRMAYVIELDDEFAESDIPTTLLRSKTDCPNIKSATTLTTNDIVINKLTQILSYLRHGARNNKKVKRKDRGVIKRDGERGDDEKEKPIMEDSIYGDIGDYVPPMKTPSNEKSSDRQRKSYFEKPNIEDDRDEKEVEVDKYRVQQHVKSEPEQNNFPHNVIEDRTRPPQKAEDQKLRSAKIYKRLNEPDSYAECYPGAPETADAIDDSDDEVDYTKMDMGNKKGPIGRWDFDTQEEYSDYMNQKEALPKAAFQYGVKMADGRKTRRTGTGKKDEKAELDREWQKISQIIAKRKASGLDPGEPEYKTSKY